MRIDGFNFSLPVDTPPDYRLKDKESDPYALDVQIGSPLHDEPKQRATDSDCRQTDSGCYGTQNSCYGTQSGCYSTQNNC